MKRTRSSPPHHKLRTLSSLQCSLFYKPLPKSDKYEVVVPFQKNYHPNILLFRDFVTEDELSNLGLLFASNSSLFKFSGSGDGYHDDTVRRSKYLPFPLAPFNLATQLAQRVTALVGLPVSHMECPELLTYLGDGQEGNYFRVHHDTAGITNAQGDAFEPSMYSDHYVDLLHDPHTYCIITGLLYLNTLPEGGTHFPKLKFTQLPLQGALLLWPNVTPTGVIECSTVHEGLPVLTPNTQKFVINFWINAQPQAIDKTPVVHLHPCVDAETLARFMQK